MTAPTIILTEEETTGVADAIAQLEAAANRMQRQVDAAVGRVRFDLQVELAGLRERLEVFKAEVVS